MHKIQRSIDIKAPATRIYEFVNRPDNLSAIWPNLVSVSNVSPKAGGASEFDYVFKMGGSQFKGHTHVEEAQPGKLARFRNDGGIPSTFRWTYKAADGSGTRLTLDVEYSMPSSLSGKLPETMQTRINERDLDTMLANLKDVVEHGTTAIGAGAPAH